LVGATQRTGSRRVWDAYLHLLLRQRRQQGPPEAVHRAPRCPARLRSDDAFSPVADATRLTSATVCRTDGTHVRAHRLSRAQVGLMRRDVATASTRRTGHDPRCRSIAPDVSGVVVGVDPWGEPVTVLIACDTYRVVRAGSDRYVFARMLPSTARMLGAMLAGR
jgi:hypothetical protein